MFANIEFVTVHSSYRLTSKRVTRDKIDKTLYSEENLLNSRFEISGSVEVFKKPPITDFAVQKLFHLQDYNIFHYDKGSFTERSKFHSFLILYTYAGKGILTYKNKTYSLIEGDGFFINCMDYHFYKAEEPWVTGILHINGPLLNAFHRQYMHTGTPVFSEQISGRFQQYLEKLLSLYNVPQLHRDWQASTCIDNLLNHLLLLNSSIIGEQTPIPEKVIRIIKYMECNYNDELTLDNISDRFFISKYHLSREFRKYTGFSPIDYLISIRINHAKHLLKRTSLPVYLIAHEVGIHDSNNFTNLFRKKMKMTPLQFRRTDEI